jgi:hypothetical protein
MNRSRLSLRHPGDAASACETFVGGLSQEELALAERARALREELSQARARGAPAEELAALQRRRGELAVEREQAWRRKMTALGHFSPTEPTDAE